MQALQRSISLHQCPTALFRCRPFHTSFSVRIEEQAISRSSNAFHYKLRGKGRQFIDLVRIVAKGGDGGDGCVSFQREKFLPKGPPNGGNGGRGGNVIVRSCADETTLRSFGRVCKAQRGSNGTGSGRHGTVGTDLIIKVPVGTVVREMPLTMRMQDTNTLDDLDDEEREARKMEERWVFYPRAEQRIVPEGRKDYFKESNRMMDQEDRYLQWRARQERELIHVDLTEPDQEVVLSRGGAGGYGNPHFLTTENRSPRWATRGRKGDVRQFELELKTIADIGLIGMPNAGKSTLLGAISNAHPKQADYAFTTLHPFVGTVDYADQYQLTVADIPGLIEGAHRNIGLGHAFLRHVERANTLVYVVDLGGEAPWDDLKTLQNELEAYRPGLTQRQSLIVANKADKVRLAKDNLVKLQEVAKGIPVIPVSARYEKNIIKLTTVMRNLVEKERAAQEEIKKQLQNETEPTD